ncbi:MAG: YfcE family phosphodiesterase [Candidatus Njordarchaeia archaeon]
MKKVVVLSDTHDNMNNIERILSEIPNLEPDGLIHCGDFVSPFAFNRFAKNLDEKIQFKAVLGNNEGEIYKIVTDYIQLSKRNVQLGKDFLEFEINGYKTLLLHGWGSIDLTRKMVVSIGKSGDYKLILFGHTHKLEITTISHSNEVITHLFGDLEEDFSRVFTVKEFKSIIINPGELSGWLSNRASYALLHFVEEKKLKVEIKVLSP